MSLEAMYEAAAKALRERCGCTVAIEDHTEQAKAAVDAVLAEMEAITTIKVESVSWERESGYVTTVGRGAGNGDWLLRYVDGPGTYAIVRIDE